MDIFKQTPIIFVGGKGGVGKTTISASIASKLAYEKKKTLIVSTDPAHSLGDVLNIQLNATPKQITPYLYAQELDAKKITDEHFKNIEDTLQGYAKPEMFGKIKEHLELSKESPGASEAAILESICKIITNEQEYEHIVFDTAPTGHTIRLLSLPSIMSAWTDGLMSRQKNRNQLKEAASVFWKKKEDDEHNPFKPTTQNRWDKAMEKLDERKKLFQDANLVLKDSKKCKIFLVMIPQVLPLEETLRTLKQLEYFSMDCGGVFANQIIPKSQTEEFWQIQVQKQHEILEIIEQKVENKNIFFVELSSKDLRGEEKLRDIEYKIENSYM